MQCQNCGQAIPQGEAACPHCQSAAAPNPGTKQFAVANLLQGILLLLMGAIALAIFTSLLLGSMGAGIGAVSAVFQAENLLDALWQSSAGTLNILILLEFFSCALWVLGGFFLVLSALLSFGGSKGPGLALTAECFMIAGYAARIAEHLIRHFQVSPSSGIGDALILTWQADWLFIFVQLVLVMVTAVLCCLKLGATRLSKRLSQSQSVPIDGAEPSPPVAGQPAANSSARRPSVQFSQDTAPLYLKRTAPQSGDTSQTEASTPKKD